MHFQFSSMCSVWWVFPFLHFFNIQPRWINFFNNCFQLNVIEFNALTAEKIPFRILCLKVQLSFYGGINYLVCHSGKIRNACMLGYVMYVLRPDNFFSTFNFSLLFYNSLRAFIRIQMECKKIDMLYGVNSTQYNLWVEMRCFSSKNKR